MYRHVLNSVYSRVINAFNAWVVTSTSRSVSVLLDTVIKTLGVVLVLGVDLKGVLGGAVHPSGRGNNNKLKRRLYQCNYDLRLKDVINLCILTVYKTFQGEIKNKINKII